MNTCCLFSQSLVRNCQGTTLEAIALHIPKQKSLYTRDYHVYVFLYLFDLNI